MEEHPQPGQAFMSALVTDHFVLQSARSTTTSEAVRRSAVYLTCVSSSLVAFGFFAAATHRLAPLLATVLPALLILGIFTLPARAPPCCSMPSAYRWRRPSSSASPRPCWCTACTCCGCIAAAGQRRHDATAGPPCPGLFVNRFGHGRSRRRLTAGSAASAWTSCQTGPAPQDRGRLGAAPEFWGRDLATDGGRVVVRLPRRRRPTRLPPPARRRRHRHRHRCPERAARVPRWAEGDAGGGRAARHPSKLMCAWLGRQRSWLVGGAAAGYPRAQPGRGAGGQPQEHRVGQPGRRHPGGDHRGGLAHAGSL